VIDIKTLLHHPHRDEFPDLRAAIEATPVRRPAPFRPAYPGVSRTVIDELRAAAAGPSPAEQVRHARTMALAPLAALLNEPVPVTDWLYLLSAVESAELADWSRLTTDYTRELDAAANELAFTSHQAHVTLNEQLAEVNAQ
jgi:hypothetical protein